MSRRGFANMAPERQREISSLGGKAAHAMGTAHEFTPEEASEAGRKGGETVSRNRAHMAMIGRRGGRALGAVRSGAKAGVDAAATAGDVDIEIVEGVRRGR